VLITAVYIVVHSTALNIEQFPFFPFILHTIITAQMKSIGGEGPVYVESLLLYR